jgi:GSH-dependent disulfide-bond oxidoreductase
MIDLYYWPTPNGHKITIFLEETEIPYRIIPVNIGEGEQFGEDFLRISPNNKMPAIVDNLPTDGQEPVPVFESGAILVYLADKTGRFLAQDLHNRYQALSWLFWQMGGLGPMAGQNHHFVQYANEKIPYAIERYVKETGRLYAVLNKQLHNREYIVGDYSIVDMACYPWIVPFESQLQRLEDFPHLKRWFELMGERPAVRRAYARAEGLNQPGAMTDEAKKVLFGQDASKVR